jgi:hypothetical protein
VARTPDQSLRDTRREQGLTSRNDANGVEELVGLRLLDHESARSRPNRFEDVPIDPEGREDHDTITRERTRAIAIWEPHFSIASTPRANSEVSPC